MRNDHGNGSRHPHAVGSHGVGDRDDLGGVADVVVRVRVRLERLGAVPCVRASCMRVEVVKGTHKFGRDRGRSPQGGMELGRGKRTPGIEHHHAPT